MKKHLFALSLVALIGVSSCGSDSSKDEAGQGDFSYKYITCLNCSDADNKCLTDQNQCAVGGCTTGQHEITNPDDVCSTLNNKAKNNNCSADSRKERFEQRGCTGTFTNS